VPTVCLGSGFRIDPEETVDDVAQEVRALHRAHFARPDFGVQFTVEAEMPSLAALAIPRVEEDVEIFDEVGCLVVPMALTLDRITSSYTLIASFAPQRVP